jgi:hypothetical protein
MSTPENIFLQNPLWDGSVRAFHFAIKYVHDGTQYSTKVNHQNHNTIHLGEDGRPACTSCSQIGRPNIKNQLVVRKISTAERVEATSE